ncbi:DNA polymerase III subunit delta [Helicobacter aurati]|uniref:DNA polymerase III subunit delta n=1 Tax=Helicobacter aurati TaxID=137778 RepID=A0A3D8J987_9HELI|nr:DNA polymerase III subunit delta' [Helicobacter aurati]RDU73411.1 DNA polymerase III subunit delta [Helicobacter aurati]
MQDSQNINVDSTIYLHSSHIILTHDFESEKNILRNNIEAEFLRIFEAQEIKTEDAHNIIKEAYITSSQTKILAVFGFSYNRFAQNALLKILEEPPNHTLFILYANTKNKLLPTIFSRLIVLDKRKKIAKESFPLNITKLTVPLIYEYIKDIEKKNYTSEQGREIVSAILHAIAMSDKTLNQYELKRFDNAIESLHNKQAVHLVLLPLLLSLIPNL